jgi:DNA-binding transcriptional LysR family regulator
VNLIDLEAFVSVVDHGSIVAAAAALHFTQSAVTRRVQNLEDAIGLSLLDRGARPLRPTLAGQETYEFAIPVLSSVSDLKGAILHYGEPSGDFRFGLPRSFGDMALTGAIQNLRTEFPKLKLHAFVQWSGVLLERLTNRKADAAIVTAGRHPRTGVVCCRTHRHEAVRCCSCEVETFQSTKNNEGASACPWVVNPTGCPTRQLLETSLLQQGLPFDTAVEAEGYELQFSLISDGVGLGLAPSDVFHASPRRKNMKFLKVKDFPLS